MAERRDGIEARIKRAADTMFVELPPVAPVRARGRRRRIVTRAGGGISAVVIAAAFVIPIVALLPIGRAPVSSGLFAPAPRTCPIEVPRFEESSVKWFRDGLGNLLPRQLPPGFGFQAAFERGPGTTGGSAAIGYWTDESCREIALSSSTGLAPDPGQAGTESSSIGRWMVSAGEPGTCGNAVLGPARCLRYETTGPFGVLRLTTSGLDRKEADAVALSILGTQTSPGPQEPEPPALEPTDLSWIGPRWTKLPAPPAVRSRSAAVVWTGSEVLVWGGHTYTGFSDEVPSNDGFRWNPVTGDSVPIAASPLTARDFAAFGWTGRELLVWGGTGRGGPFQDGAAYSPETDSWRSILDSPLDARTPAISMWTGDEFLIIGDSSRPQRSGASYDPQRDRWAPIPDVPERPLEGIWTGSEAIVRTGQEGSSLFRWAPGNKAWEPLPAPSQALSTIAWDGSGIVGLTRDHRAFRYEMAGGPWQVVGGAPLPENNYGPRAIGMPGLVFDVQAHAIAILDGSIGSWIDITPRNSQSFGDTFETLVADDVLISLRRNNETGEERALVYRPPSEMSPL